MVVVVEVRIFLANYNTEIVYCQYFEKCCIDIYGFWNDNLSMNNSFRYNPDGMPDAIKTGFRIPEPMIWVLDLPVEEIPISEIANNLDVPYLEREGTDDWNLCVRELVANFDHEPHHAQQTLAVDLTFPIELYSHNGQWIILDGVHRLTKAVREGRETILVRRIPESAIQKLLGKV